MISKRIWIIGLALILVIGIVACTRSITSSPTTIQATQEGAGEPEATNDLMNQLVQFATQTANAATGGEPTVAEQATAVPEENEQTGEQPTAVPEVEATVPAEPEQVAPTNTPQLQVVVVPTATPGIPQTYTLHKGENLYCLARRFNVNPTEMMNLNGIGPNTLQSPGLVLKIPQTGNPFPGNRSRASHPTTYTVNAGETIYSIACVFGDVDPSAIVYANRLVEPYTLTVGQVLQIP